MESEKELRDRARRKAEMKLGFLTSLIVLIFVNSLLFVRWWYSGLGFLWTLIVFAFWGIGLVSYAFRVFGSDRYIEGSTEREYQRLKEKK